MIPTQRMPQMRRESCSSKASKSQSKLPQNRRSKRQARSPVAASFLPEQVFKKGNVFKKGPH
eukprot:8825245-Karenia_brevis.AAC.1